MARRTYALDEHFFDAINTEEKAYYFGLLCADGYNFERKGAVTLKLTVADRELVDGFRSAVGYAGKPRLVQPKSQFATARPQVQLTACSVVLSRQLASLGCTARKSKTLRFPAAIPAALVRHFVRGYFDGDGCVCVPKRGCPVVSFISSRRFCGSLCKVLAAAGIVSKARTYHRSSGVDELWIHRKASTVQMFRYLYDGATVYLKRKHTRFLAAVARAEWQKPVMTAEQAVERARERHRKWVAANPEIARESNRASHIRRRDKVLATLKAYRTAHPEKYVEYERRRAERMASDPAYRARRLELRRVAAQRRLRLRQGKSRDAVELKA